MHTASSSGSCSGLASAIVLHECTKLTGITSLPTITSSVAQSLLGLTRGSIGLPTMMNSTPLGYRRCGSPGKPYCFPSQGEQLRECLDFSRSSRRSTSGAYERRSRDARVRCDLPEFWTSRSPQPSGRKRSIAKRRPQ